MRKGGKEERKGRRGEHRLECIVRFEQIGYTGQSFVKPKSKTGCSASVLETTTLHYDQDTAHVRGRNQRFEFHELFCCFRRRARIRPVSAL